MTNLLILLGLLMAPITAAGLRSLLPEAVPGTAVGPNSAPAEYDETTLANFIDGAAEVYRRYGFVRAVTADYGSGDAAITCTVYEMTDARAAFRVFSHFRGERKGTLQIGDGAFGADFQLAFWQEKYFVMVETYSTDAREAETLEAFARTVSTRIRAHGAKR